MFIPKSQNVLKFTIPKPVILYFNKNTFMIFFPFVSASMRFNESFAKGCVESYSQRLDFRCQNTSLLRLKSVIGNRSLGRQWDWRTNLVKMKLKQLMPTWVERNWAEGRKGVIIINIIQSIERAASATICETVFPSCLCWKATLL